MTDPVRPDAPRDDELTARDRAAFLLTLVCAYRRKRAVDGLNGRMWDGSVHLSAEREIDVLEAQWLAVRESTSAPFTTAAVQCAAPADPDADICWCRKNPCICLRHDSECETELTSHGYTPCRCAERASVCICEIDRHDFNCPVHNDADHPKRGPNGDE